MTYRARALFEKGWFLLLIVAFFALTVFFPLMEFLVLGREGRRIKHHDFRVVEDRILRVGYDEYNQIGPFYRHGVLRYRSRSRYVTATFMLDQEDTRLSDVFYFERNGRVPVPYLLAHILSADDECYLVFFPKDADGVAYVYSKRSYRAVEGLIERDQKAKREVP